MDSKTFIKKAKSAVENGKKTEALGLYKQGIKIILEEIKDKNLKEDERNKLKQDCSEYLSTAEKLQREISDDGGQTEGTQSSSDEDIDKYVDALIERQTDNALTLSDVCGCQHAKDQLKECGCQHAKDQLKECGCQHAKDQLKECGCQHAKDQLKECGCQHAKDQLKECGCQHAKDQLKECGCQHAKDQLKECGCQHAKDQLKECGCQHAKDQLKECGCHHAKDQLKECGCHHAKDQLKECGCQHAKDQLKECGCHHAKDQLKECGCHHAKDQLKECGCQHAKDQLKECGCHHAKDQLKECVVIPIKFPQLFQGARPRPWEGILLYGAPGTGKTMLGRAIAGEYPEISFIRVPASDFISRYIKEPDKVIKIFFKKVRQLKPCIIFIEDIDLLLCNDDDKYRKAKCELLVQKEGIGLDNDQTCVIFTTYKPWKFERGIWRRMIRQLFIKVKNQKSQINILFIDDLEVLFLKDQYQCENVRRVARELLCQIDGCENVLILTATNEPWIIPHHFLKRFNRRLHIPLPDKETRTQLLIKFFETVKHEITDDDFKTIAEQLEEFTGADINCLARDAAMEAVREFQTATHFRKVKQTINTNNPSDEDNYQYAVCSPDHPEAVTMSFDDLLKLDSNKLYERPITKDDLMKCVEKAKPSVDKEYYKNCKILQRDLRAKSTYSMFSNQEVKSLV